MAPGIIKHAVGEGKAKLLFIMGATWFNSSLFDLETETDSFATLLNKQGITTYTFDNFGSNFGDVRDHVGNRHEENKRYAVELVKEHGIDYVMGYSYGCLAAKHVAETCKLKGVIFLDPGSNTKSEKKQINGGDRFLFTISTLKNTLSNNGATLSERVLNDHISALTDQDTFTSPAYPITGTEKDRKDFYRHDSLTKLKQKMPVMSVFTKNSNEAVRNLFSDTATKFYTDASHWILIEEKRNDLSNDLIDFITNSQRPCVI